MDTKNARVFHTFLPRSTNFFFIFLKKYKNCEGISQMNQLKFVVSEYTLSEFTKFSYPLILFKKFLLIAYEFSLMNSSRNHF